MKGIMTGSYFYYDRVIPLIKTTSLLWQGYGLVTL